MSLCFDPSRPIDISNPTRFWNTPSVDAFHLPKAAIEPVRAGDFVGDTLEGGAVNCFSLTVCPHGNGTHTECVGHIVHDRVSVLDCHNGRLLVAELVRVRTVRMSATSEGYEGLTEGSDWVVDSTALSTELAEREALEALILCVMGPDGQVFDGHFSGQNAPYFTSEAMTLISGALAPSGHLLTNLPSIDREQCGGFTPNHRILWGLGPKSRCAKDARYGSRTLTELIQSDPNCPDGAYVLDLHIAPFDTDAAPSRPILYQRT